MSDRDKPLVKWIEDLRSGDRIAFEHIYYQFESKLFQFALKFTGNRDEAEEVVQEVFVRLWERRHFIDPSRNFDGYLFRITRNIVYNHARHRAYEMAYFKYLDNNYNHTDNLTENRMDFEELQHVLEEIFNDLPPVRKQIFIMSRIEGLSNAEIAEALQTSTSNIENHIYKALRTIRQKFEKYRIIYMIEVPILIMAKLICALYVG
ncbi:RNA polymerase sigma factor [Larkinella sp. GY13]|uniref:RNA polymerase sigma factor n=1 Tax=Larkinella sp. GY13 TaxID=3453720 RepID=UPI003EE9F43E